MHGTSRYRGKTTYVELLTIVGLLAVFTTILLGAKAATDTQANRLKCRDHLHQIGLAMIMYSNGEKNGGFPRVLYDFPTIDKPNFFTAVDAKDPFGDKGPTNDVTAAMYLLIRTQDVKPAVFICPATEQEALTFPEGKSATDYSNFPNGKCISYSMNYADPDANAVSSGYRWNSTLDGHFAVMADKNPGDDALLKLTASSSAGDLRKGNSLNHSQDGQNVLYADGTVEFRTTPFCGLEQDNIYTYGTSGKTSGGKGIVGAPDDFGDSVCLPTAKQDDPTK